MHNLDSFAQVGSDGRKIKSITNTLYLFSKGCEFIGLLSFVLQLIYYYQHPVPSPDDASIVRYNIYQSSFSTHNTVLASLQLLLLMRTYMTLRTLPGTARV